MIAVQRAEQDRGAFFSAESARRATRLALTVDRAGVTRPIYPAFVAAAGNDEIGYALLPVDADGVVRRFDERIAVHDGPVSTLVGQMAHRLGRTVVGAGLIDFAAGAAFDFIPLQTVFDRILLADTMSAWMTRATRAASPANKYRYQRGSGASPIFSRRSPRRIGPARRARL